MTTLPQAIQFARNYVADPEGCNAPWPDQMALILAHLDAQRRALQSLLQWADADSLDNRRMAAIDTGAAMVAALSPTSEPAICVDCGALPTDETGHESFCEREPPAEETNLERVPASPAQIARARSEYGSDDLEIDDNALASRNDESGGTWVAAWVWLGDEGEV